MANIPLQNEPNTLNRMQLPEGLRDWAKKRLAQTPDPEQLNDIPNLLFITGGTGTGKGTFIRNLIRATHCRNREAGTGEPCGECDICQSDPREVGELGNVVWVECGSREGESDYKKVQHAMKVSKAGPHHTGSPAHDVLFIVFDEVHLLSSADQSALLTVSEHNAPDVKYVCITAEPEEMKTKVRKMLKGGRGAHIAIPTPRPVDIKAYLKSKLDWELSEESLDLIASKAEGSYREAISDLYLVGQHDPSYSPDTVASLLQTLTWNDRKAFWEQITGKGVRRAQLRQAVESIKQKADDWAVAQALLDDLYFSEEADENDNLTAIRLLTEWCRKPYEFDLKYVLIQLKGLNCVDLEQEAETALDRQAEEVRENYAPV